MKLPQVPEYLALMEKKPSYSEDHQPEMLTVSPQMLTGLLGIFNKLFKSIMLERMNFH